MKPILVIGSAIPEITGNVQDLPELGQDVTLTNMHESVGGCAMNILCDIHAQGGAALALLPIGSGMWGEFTQKEIRARGITNLADPSVVFANKDTQESEEKNSLDSPMRPSHGFCLTLVDASGERTFLTSENAQAEFSDTLLEHMSIPPDAYVYASGYEITSDTGPVLARWLRSCFEENPFHLVLDPGPLAADCGQDIFGGLEEIAEGITANEEEVRAIFGKKEIGKEKNDSENTASGEYVSNITRWLFSRKQKSETELQKNAELKTDSAMQLDDQGDEHSHLPWILVRSSHAGTMYRVEDEELSMREIPFEKSRALVNTSGAGDAHTAGLMWALASGFSLEEAVNIGHEWARKVVELPDPHL